jgi:P27 family predicted phage terminase small subunit
MGILKTPDRAVLAGLCQNWAVFVKTSKQINKCGAIDKDTRPIATTNSDAYKNYLRACEQFGLTPSARTRIDTDIEGRKLDAFDQFVQRKKA